jgi:hypothetical protein
VAVAVSLVVFAVVVFATPPPLPKTLLLRSVHRRQMATNHEPAILRRCRCRSRGCRPRFFFHSPAVRPSVLWSVHTIKTKTGPYY